MKHTFQNFDKFDEDFNIFDYSDISDNAFDDADNSDQINEKIGIILMLSIEIFIGIMEKMELLEISESPEILEPF